MVYSYSNNEMNSTLARGDIYRVYLPVFELAAASSLDLSWTYVCPWLLTDGPIPDLYRTYAWIYLWICLCHIMIFMIKKSCRPITPKGGKVGGGHRAHTHTHIRTYSWIYPWSYSGAIPGLRPGSISDFLQLFLDFSDLCMIYTI